jgi:hypothetical protein
MNKIEKSLSRIENMLFKANEGDKRMIFGKPFEYKGGKWMPTSAGGKKESIPKGGPKSKKDESPSAGDKSIPKKEESDKSKKKTITQDKVDEDWEMYSDDPDKSVKEILKHIKVEDMRADLQQLHDEYSSDEEESPYEKHPKKMTKDEVREIWINANLVDLKNTELADWAVELKYKDHKIIKRR